MVIPSNMVVRSLKDNINNMNMCRNEKILHDVDWAVEVRDMWTQKYETLVRVFASEAR